VQLNHPERNQNGARLTSLQERISGRFRPAFVVLLCAVGCVLLIACTNLSNLRWRYPLRDARRSRSVALIRPLTPGSPDADRKASRCRRGAALGPLCFFRNANPPALAISPTHRPCVIARKLVSHLFAACHRTALWDVPAPRSPDGCMRL
jgi:hypothetical protein